MGVCAASNAMGPGVATLPQACGTGKRLSLLISHSKELRETAVATRAQLSAAIGTDVEVLLADESKSTLDWLAQIRSGDGLLVLDSGGILAKPEFILTLCTAIESALPMIAVDVRNEAERTGNAKPRLSDSVSFVTYLDQDLDFQNSGGTETLRTHGISSVDAAYLLSCGLVQISYFKLDISKLDTMMSLELADELLGASPVLIKTSKLEWSESRDVLREREELMPSCAKKSSWSPDVRLQHSTEKKAGTLRPFLQNISRGKASPSQPTMAPLIPQLPKPRSWYVALTAMETLVRGGIVDGKGSCSTVAVHGPSGSGKSALAAAVITSLDVRRHFDRICYACVGDLPDIPALRLQLLDQLSDGMLDTPNMEQVAVTEATAAISGSLRVLIYLDAVAAVSDVEALLDAALAGATTRALITARSKGFGGRSALEFMARELSPSEAAAVFMQALGSSGALGDKREAFEAAQLCGYTPLALQLYGRLSRELGKDTAKQLLEPRLRRDPSPGSPTEAVLASAFALLESPEHERSMLVLLGSVVFPEDVPIPMMIFRAMAKMFVQDAAPVSEAFNGHPAWSSTLLRLGLLEEAHREEHLLLPRYVRAYALRHYSGNNFRETQRDFIKELFECVPAESPCGPGRRSTTSRRAADAYIGTHAWWHIVMALGEDVRSLKAASADEIRRRTAAGDLLDAENHGLLQLLTSGSEVWARACAAALGTGLTLALGEKAAAGGEALVAARLFWAATLLDGRGGTCRSVEAMGSIRCALAALSSAPAPAEAAAVRLERVLLDGLAAATFGDPPWLLTVPSNSPDTALLARRPELLGQKSDVAAHGGGTSPSQSYFDARESKESFHASLVESLRLYHGAITMLTEVASRSACTEMIMEAPLEEAARVPVLPPEITSRIEEASEMAVEAARRCLEAVDMIQASDQDAARMARIFGLRHFALFWSRSTVAAATRDHVVDQLLGPCGDASAAGPPEGYEHRRDGALYRSVLQLNILIDGAFILPLFSRGRLFEALKAVNWCCEFWESHLAQASRAGMNGLHALELAACCQSLLPVLIRLRLRTAGRLACALGLCEQRQLVCKAIWSSLSRRREQLVPTCPELLEASTTLLAYAADPSSDGEAAKGQLRALASRIDAGEPSWDLACLEWGVYEAAFAAAERLGDERHMEIFASAGVQRYAGYRPAAQAALLGGQARIADRAQCLEIAESLRISAAALALQAGEPLQVLAVDAQSSSGMAQEQRRQAFAMMDAQAGDISNALIEATEKMAL